MLAGGALYGSAFALTAAGVYAHSLPLVYAGNALCGVGYGVAYMPPIQALMEWFPDRRGMASGSVIAGFGCGALIFSPAVSALAEAFSSAPVYLGAGLKVVNQGGALMAEVGGKMVEVVYATAAEVSRLPYPAGLEEGYYLVGSGNTGAAAALLGMAGFYLAALAACTAAIRKPPPGYLPPGMGTPAAAASATPSNLGNNVHVDMVPRTPQFWLLFSTATLLGTGGMGLMSVAKPMVGEIFAGAMPTVVTVSFASSFLMAMACGNLLGRAGWSSFSDAVGRRNTFHLFTATGAGLFAFVMPHCIAQAATDPAGPYARLYLLTFCASSVAAVSIMGGTFACLPAYEADLYGPKYVQVSLNCSDNLKN